MTQEKKTEHGQRKNIRGSQVSSKRKQNAMDKTRKRNARKHVPGYEEYK